MRNSVFRRIDGLSGGGAVAVAVGMGLAGGLFDVLTGPGLRAAFAVCFVAGCSLAALAVRRRDLVVTVVMPPLVYLLIALVIGFVQRSDQRGSPLVRHALDLFTALVLEAPALMVATGAALAIALARGLGRHRAAPDRAGKAI